MTKVKLRGEVNSGQLVVDPAGYRPLPVIVRSLEIAGEQLLMARRGEIVGDMSDEEMEAQADADFVTDDSDELLDLGSQLSFFTESEKSVSNNVPGRDRVVSEGEKVVENPPVEG